MAKILSFHLTTKLGKENPLKSVWQEFRSLDTFTKFFIITYILVILATPFIITNYQIINLHGESESQRLREISRLQEFQRSFYSLSRASEAAPTPTPIPENIISRNPDNSVFEIKTYFALIVNYIKHVLLGPVKETRPSNLPMD